MKKKMPGVRSLVLSVFVLGAGAVAEPQETSPANDEKTRFRLLVQGGFNSTTTSFADVTTFTAFLEQGSSRRSYETSTGFVFEVGGIYSFTSALGILGAFELFEGDNEGAFEHSVPHPLFFNRNRSVTGDVSGLSYTERAIHLDLVFTRELGSTTLDLFAGPTFFFIETQVISDVSTSEAYPFDDLSLVSTSSVKLDDNPVGFNAGAALTFRFTDVLGVAFQARFSRASVGIQRSGGEPIELDAGGFRAGGGIRIAF